ncbi:slipin family protein [Luteolibacter pohnpeiensis]|uniref:Slipin family protein n=1 Tax=Luteolibacter pohnpeiensis TaxID=454153 RepID=A0A934SC43_9BACT|nr:slipin family protein [Luteolibacter pohnpeiensis]MBK1883437.1 slipin family protein [Luteolibacter pohnpeiensis]
MIVFLLLFVILIIFSASGIKIDREYQRGVIFRLGRFKHIKGPGIYWIIPMVDQKVQVDIRTATVDIESQETVTRDSVTIKVNAVLYYKVSNPEKAIISVKNYQTATYQAALTTLRNVIGQHILDEVLKDRDKINKAARDIVDQITDPWGLKVELVEMKDVELPQTMQRAMAREAEASREKRARLIKAEAEQEASLKLTDAAKSISENPAALELRRMQMISEVGTENNTTTIVIMPSDFVTMAKGITQLAQNRSSEQKPQSDQT